jgi:putative membrane protein
MMYWNGHMSTAGWILSILWTLIIVALVVAGIVWLVSALGNRGADARAPSSGPSAREILDRRLASGELTPEQYQQLRDTIEVPGDARGPDRQPPRAVDTPPETIETQR